MKKKALIINDVLMIPKVLENKVHSLNKEIEVVANQNYDEVYNTLKENSKEIFVAIFDINIENLDNDKIITLLSYSDIPTIILSKEEDDNIKDKHRDFIIEFVKKRSLDSLDYIAKKIENLYLNSKNHILLIEDNEEYLEKMTNVLKYLNINILVAKTGKNAFEYLEENKFHINLIITEDTLIDMKSTEFIHQVRKIKSKDEVGIIVLTEQKNNQELICDSFRHGANDFMSKDFIKEEFILRLNNVIELLYLFNKNKEIANKDFLTGAYNRRFFFDTAQTIVGKNKRKKQKILTAIFDIDFFKKINDKYGHAIGDKALKEFHKILKDNTRDSDIIARIGGEEFIILLEDISFENAKKLLEKLRYKVEDHHIKLNETEFINMTVSIGAVYKNVNDIHVAMKKADDLLYVSKEEGRNQVNLIEE